MRLFDLIALLVVLSAFFSYLNYRLIKLPLTIGVMLLALLASLLLIALGEMGQFGLQLKQHAAQVLHSIDFGQALLNGMLAFLLFAGALHINLNDLGAQKAPVTLLATVGVLVSTLIIGTLTWLTCRVLELDLPLLHCMLFGALISPTDPIAVIGIVRNAGAPRILQVQIAGESLFNDGVGVVVFLIILQLAGAGPSHGPHRPDALLAAWLLLKEAGGGALFGLAAGYLAFLMLRGVNNYKVEVLLTLALVMGGYAIAMRAGISAPIAIVVAGLLIGNHGRAFAMSDQTRQRLDDFWELVDEILNAVLFLLIGLEVLVMPMSLRNLAAALLAIPIALLARWISVLGVIEGLRFSRPFAKGAVAVLTWAGLRGGISVAMALSLPPGSGRELILGMTYAVVIFSILVQGLTTARVIQRFVPAEAEPAPASAPASGSTSR